MRLVKWFSSVLLASAFVVIGFGSGPAAAAPCCSAPICQRDFPPPICASCGDCESDDAAVEEVAVAAAGYDDQYADDVCSLDEEAA
jgi:hypothetical protein